MTQCYPPRGLRRISAPATEPVTLSETKLFLRVDSSTEDTLISTLITAAREAAENYLRKSFITQGWEISYNDMIPQRIALPMRPIQSITSIVCDSTTLSAESYALNAAKDTIDCASSIYGNLITITYVAGYGSSASSVPTAIKQALLHHIASMYDDRTHESIPSVSLSLLQPYREVRL
jgi:uncharacterized phiE125 gp8 family phage protein